MVRTRFTSNGGPPTALALDPTGTRLLITLPDGTLLVHDQSAEQRGCEPTANCSVVTGSSHAVAHGVQGAAWLPHGS